jgi:hypothetical protein
VATIFHKEAEMTVLFTANLVTNFVFGLGFTIFPDFMLSLFEPNMSAEFTFVTRMFGSALLGTCIVLWYARRSEDKTILDLAARSNLLYWLLGSIILLFANLDGLFNFMGWVTFGEHAFFTLWYVYKMFIRP